MVLLRRFFECQGHSHKHPQEFAWKLDLLFVLDSIGHMKGIDVGVVLSASDVDSQTTMQEIAPKPSKEDKSMREEDNQVRVSPSR